MEAPSLSKIPQYSTDKSISKFFAVQLNSFRYLYASVVDPDPYVFGIVADPGHFGTDPYLQIRASDQWIQLRLRIMLFSSLSFKTLTNNNFFLSSKVIQKSQSSRNQGFLTIFA